MSVQDYVGTTDKITKDVRAGKWLTIDKMGVYWAEVLEQPTISVYQTEGTYCLLSESGELHALIAEYDKDGNLVKNYTPVYPDESEYVAARSADDGLVDLDDTSWRNKLAEQGEIYTLSAPQTEGNYLMIRTKSVYRTNQSEELLRYITAGGITTGVETIGSNTEASQPLYYTLSGIPVNHPSKGIFIKVSGGGKAEKVSIE
ncbi:MAG: hypothetical protein ACI4AK_05625 [Lepagella sp.]